MDANEHVRRWPELHRGRGYKNQAALVGAYSDTMQRTTHSDTAEPLCCEPQCRKDTWPRVVCSALRLHSWINLAWRVRCFFAFWATILCWMMMACSSKPSTGRAGVGGHRR